MSVAPETPISARPARQPARPRINCLAIISPQKTLSHLAGVSKKQVIVTLFPVRPLRNSQR